VSLALMEQTAPAENKESQESPGPLERQVIPELKERLVLMV
jgi:hypothetical protein